MHTYGLTLSVPIIFHKQLPTEHAFESINAAAMNINLEQPQLRMAEYDFA